MMEEKGHQKATNHGVKALICALKFRNAKTLAHSNRVLFLSQEVGQACELTIEELKIVRLAACFHDVGKIGIPDEILLKPSRLDEHERNLMKSHSVKGAEIIQWLDVENIELVADTVRHHHEYHDGRGYPDGLSGEAISVYARIVSIVDSYDAITESRPYHKHRTHAQAMELIDQETGTKFDPIIARNFVRVIERSRHRVH